MIETIFSRLPTKAGFAVEFGQRSVHQQVMVARRGLLDSGRHDDQALDHQSHGHIAPVNGVTLRRCGDPNAGRNRLGSRLRRVSGWVPVSTR